MRACSPPMAPKRCERAAQVHGKMLRSWDARWPRRCSTAARTVCFGSRGAALNTVKSRSLEGRRIVVTRAPEQSKELLDRLRAAGAEAISLPLVRFLEPQDTV